VPKSADGLLPSRLVDIGSSKERGFEPFLWVNRLSYTSGCHDYLRTVQPHQKIKEGLKASNAIIFTVYYYNTVLIGFPLLFIRHVYLLGIIAIRLQIFYIMILFYFSYKAVLTFLLL
jgi:hypothetical protein